MTKKASLFGAVTAFLLAGGPLSAHHSFAAEYDANRPVTLRGTLTSVELTNPHGWIHLDVKDPDGNIVHWSVETNNANALLRAGLRKTDFVAGTAIVVEGFQSKNGRPIANGRDIRFADGRNFFLSSSGPSEGAVKQ